MDKALRMERIVGQWIQILKSLDLMYQTRFSPYPVVWVAEGGRAGRS